MKDETYEVARRGLNRAVNVLAAVLATAALLHPMAGSAQRQLLDKVVAIVDDDVVLLSEYESRVSELRAAAERSGRQLPPEDQLRTDVLEQLILENLQLQFAARASIRYDDDTINRVLASMAGNNGLGLAEYVAMLQSQGAYLQTREQVRRQLTIGELQRGYVNSRITVTEQEIENFLNSNTGREVMAEEYYLEHLVVTRAEEELPGTLIAKQAYAAGLLARVRAGETLAQVRNMAVRAGEYPITATNFGWRKVAALPAVFAALVPEMAIGEVRGPLEANNGYHLIQLVDRRGGTEHISRQHQVRHLLLTPNELRDDGQSLELLLEFRSRILAGESFAAIARQHSDDPSSVVAGGDLGWLEAETLPPAMTEAVLSLEVNELSEPVRTEAGWHLIEVLGERDADVSADYARAAAERALRERKFDLELQNWLIEIREKAFVDFVE